MRRVLPLLAVLLSAPAFGQGFAPEDAVKRMTLPDGFTVTCVASEPTIRQPLSLSFDDRGRLWVLQFIQYPDPAGLKPVKRDQYLRTIWDKVPEPPPRGAKGADRLTILSDPDDRGVFRKSRDFLTGLNLASGFCLGNGGVYVAQPPYLLFYPDKDADDVPDGDPTVLLTGFGLDDTHSLANSLQWGPDGWLYGAAGSTSTSRITNPADPKAAPVEFQQGIWRYHPKSKRFELFSEGGGNTYGLDFDRHGQAIAGTNWGGFACLHQMPGAYHVKGFSKHGPLHNPHAYGYFDHVPYTGFKGGHVTCGGILYQADAFPPEYRDQYIAANLLSNAIHWHKLEPNGSTFKASHGGELLAANDTWSRPVDLCLGPDGAVYVADWYDKRAAHLDPVDTWDRTNGRVYKIEYKGTPKLAPFDLRTKTADELVDLLKHPNVWWRREARRLLAERGDTSVLPRLRANVWHLKGHPKPDDEQLALESLWAVYGLGWLLKTDSLPPFASAREWLVRLRGDEPRVGTSTRDRPSLIVEPLVMTSPRERAQLASTAKRLPANQGVPLAVTLLQQRPDDADPFAPLLIWWAFEKHASDPGVIREHLFPARQSWDSLVGRLVLERLARRYFAADPARWTDALDLLDAAETDRVREAILAGIELALRETAGRELRPEVASSFGVRAQRGWNTPTLSRVLLRLEDADERAAALKRLTDAGTPDAERAKTLDLLAQVKAPELPAVLPTLLAQAKADPFRVAVLSALEGIDDPKTADAVLAGYAKWSPAVRKRAVGLLTSRPAWALALLNAVDSGAFPKADLSVDAVRPVVAFNNPAVTKLAEKHWGKIGPAAPGEKLARIAALNLLLSREGLGDPARGKVVFSKQCAACHQFHGDGGKVGPDLTTADRKNRGYMLAQIVDPSGYVRPEYLSYKVDTADGRTLTGLVTEANGAVTVTNVVDNQPQRATVPKSDVEAMTASPVSLMPEKLLDSLGDGDVRDLFAYFMADPPAAAKESKKLRVALVSGSVEYKSDDSLAAFQTKLEKDFGVECVRAFRKTDTDIPGLDALETCDVAVFFTRRLSPPPDQLERIKKYVASGKPVVGVRTASHGFQNWLEMDAEVFGGSYKGHAKHGVLATADPVAAAGSHPVLAGVKGIKTTGGLYLNPTLAKDVTVLMTATNGKNAEPVAWVRERKANGAAQRVFYTSLGTPDDFADPQFQRLLTNGLFWAAGRDPGATK